MQDCLNKRGRLKYRGYGYAKTEQCIDIITALLFSFAYNKDLFIKDKIPKGFIKIMGDVNDETVRKVRQAWISEMEGYGGRFKVPIVPSGKDGVGIDWQSLGMTNRDMEYNKLINLMMSIIGAIYGMDLAEIGIKTQNYNSLIAESGEKRIQHSKDSGLGSLLMYIETFCNKILAKVSPFYQFVFTGVKNEDREAEAKVHRAEIESYRTINEVREEVGIEKINEEYADVVLNPQAVSVYNQSKQADREKEQQAQMGEGGIGGEAEAEFAAPEEAVEEMGEIEGGEGLGGGKEPIKKSFVEIEI